MIEVLDYLLNCAMVQELVLSNKRQKVYACVSMRRIFLLSFVEHSPWLKTMQ